MRGDRLASVLQHYMVPPSTTEDGEPHPSVEVAVQLAHLELEGGAETEGRLHHRFAEWRTEGEWFSPAREIREWIDQEKAKRG